MLNLRKIDLNLVFCYKNPCIFYCLQKNAYNSSVIHQNPKEKSIGLYDHWTHFEVKTQNWTL